MYYTCKNVLSFKHHNFFFFFVDKARNSLINQEMPEPITNSSKKDKANYREINYNKLKTNPRKG